MTKNTADPIYAAIEAYKQAEKAFSETMIVDEMEETDPGYKTALAKYERADRQASRLCAKMCSTRPTTIAGLAFLFENLGRDVHYFSKGAYSDGRTDKFFQTVTDALVEIANAEAIGGSHRRPVNHHAIAAE